MNFEETAYEIRFGLKRKLRLALAVENRYADFQGSGLRLRFSSVSVAPLEKIVATAFSLKDRYAIFNSACSVFFCGSAYLTF